MKTLHRIAYETLSDNYNMFITVFNMKYTSAERKRIIDISQNAKERDVKQWIHIAMKRK